MACNVWPQYPPNPIKRFTSAVYPVPPSAITGSAAFPGMPVDLLWPGSILPGTFIFVITWTKIKANL